MARDGGQLGEATIDSTRLPTLSSAATVPSIFDVVGSKKKRHLLDEMGTCFLGEKEIFHLAGVDGPGGSDKESPRVVQRKKEYPSANFFGA